MGSYQRSLRQGNRLFDLTEPLVGLELLSIHLEQRKNGVANLNSANVGCFIFLSEYLIGRSPSSKKLDLLVASCLSIDAYDCRAV